MIEHHNTSNANPLELSAHLNHLKLPLFAPTHPSIAPPALATPYSHSHVYGCPLTTPRGRFIPSLRPPTPATWPTLPRQRAPNRGWTAAPPTSFRLPYQHGGVCRRIAPRLKPGSLTLPDVDLTNLAPKLDNTASDIASHQRDSTVQRKELAQKTKDFRKLDDAAKLTEVKGLLKCA